MAGNQMMITIAAKNMASKALDQAKMQLGLIGKEADKNNKKWAKMASDYRKAGGKMASTSKSVQKSLQDVNTAASKTPRFFDDITKGILKGAGAIKGFDLAMQALGSTFSNAMNYEQQKISFDVLFNTVAEGRKQLQDLALFAKETPFQVQGLRDSALQMKAYNVATDNIIPTLGLMGNLSRGNTEIMNRLTYAYGQITAAGKLYGTEMRQLTETGLPVGEYLSKAIGIPLGDVKKKMEQGAISAKDLTKALILMQKEKFGGLMAKQSRTMRGAIDRVKESVMLFQERLADTKAYKSAVSSMLWLGDNMNKILAGIVLNVELLRTSLLTLGKPIASVLSGISTAVGNVKTDLRNNKNAAIIEARKAVKEIGTEMEKIPTEGLFKIDRATAVRNRNELRKLAAQELPGVGSKTSAIDAMKEKWKGVNFAIDEVNKSIIEQASIINEKVSNKSFDYGKIDLSLITDPSPTSKPNNSTSKVMKKLSSSVTRAKETFRDMRMSVQSDLSSLEQAHADKIGSIQSKIKGLNQSLADLQKSAFADMRSEQQKQADAVIKQEEKIAKIKEDISKGKQGGDNVSVLQDQLAKEEAALASFADKAKLIEGDINAARELNRKTNFERVIIDSEARIATIEAEFNKKQENINREIEAQKTAQEEENALYDRKKQNLDRFQNAFSQFSGKLKQGWDSMASNAETQANRIVNAVSRMQAALDMSTGGGGGNFGGARANGGPVESGKTYLVGERGPELFTPSRSGGITSNDKISSPTVNISFGSVNVQSESDQQGIAQMVTSAVTNAMIQINQGVRV